MLCNLLSRTEAQVIKYVNHRIFTVRVDDLISGNEVEVRITELGASQSGFRRVHHAQEFLVVGVEKNLVGSRRCREYWVG